MNGITTDHARLREQLCRVGHTLSRHGLVDAFGHVSARTAEGFVITGPQPLGVASPERIGDVTLDAAALPAGVPLEAWIHQAIYRARPDVAAIVRAQPTVATALGSAGVPIQPLHGQGSFCGPVVPVFDEAVLVRDRARGERVARTLADAPVLLLRGNGAVAVGTSPATAGARMWVLEKSAQLNATAASAGSPHPLAPDEQDAWRRTEDELLTRLWAHLEGETA